MSVSSTFAKFAGSLNVGLIQDRTSSGDETVGSCFQLGPDIFVSVASALAPFRQHPQALKIVHSASRSEFFVEAISFHPDFHYAVALRELGGAKSDFNPQISHNCCFLHVGSNQRKLSTRATNAVSAALRHPLDLSKAEFRGALAKIDMALIVQTLNSARSDGILYLCDSHMRPIAQVYCLNGRIVGALYENLANETAMYQIIQKGFPTTFAFLPLADLSAHTPAVLRLPVDALLLEAHRRVDELAPLRDLFPDGSTFKATSKVVTPEVLTEDARPFASRILERLDPYVSVEDLWLAVGYDDYTIYKTISELVGCNLVEIISSSGQAHSERVHELPAAACAEIQISNSLDAGAEIADIFLIAGSKKLLARSGRIQSAHPAVPGMFIHDIPLLSDAVGSPMVQDGKIVGMHCGSTLNPLDKSLEVRNALLSMPAILELRKTMLPVLQENQKRIAQGLNDEDEDSADDITAAFLDDGGHHRKAPRSQKARKSPIRNFLSIVLWFILGYVFVVSANRAMEFFGEKAEPQSAPISGAKH